MRVRRRSGLPSVLCVEGARKRGAMPVVWLSLAYSLICRPTVMDPIADILRPSLADRYRLEREIGRGETQGIDQSRRTVLK